MKNITVELCVCPKCVMHGAMDLLENINSIKKMKSLRNKYSMKITTAPCLDGCQHDGNRPVVSLNGEILENEKENEVMSRILNVILAE